MWRALILFAIIYVLTMVFLEYKAYRKLQKHKSPFELHEMTTLVKCSKCGKTIERPFKRFEYIGQTTNECCGKTTIIGIYCIHKKTKKELKYEKMVAKWR